MFPSTSAPWSTSHGSNYYQLPAGSSLANFGEKAAHRMSTNQPPTDFWGGQHLHRPPPPPEETPFARRRPPVAEPRYQQSDVPWASSFSAAVSSTCRRAAGMAAAAAVGLPVKDELTDASDYSSSEDTCSDYRGGGGASSDYRGGDLEDRCRRTAKDRKPDSDETMTAEEIEKRRQRRERNKMAAARCRQRRVDLTNQLLAETETLEDERDRLQREIQALQNERWQLEDLLGSHAARCKGRTTTTATVGDGHVIDVPPIKTERSDGDYYCFNMADTAGSMHHHHHHQHHRVPSYGSYATPPPPPPTTTKTTTAASFSPCSSRRPDSLPLTRRPAATPAPPAAAATAAVAAVANLDLHCMLDGHTGLTPITGAVPGSVCSPVDCGRYSPTTLMTL